MRKVSLKKKNGIRITTGAWTKHVTLKTASSSVPNEIATAMNPMVYELLRLAEIGDQTLKKRQTASVKPAVTVKPTSTIGGRANPSAGKSPADMSMEEYVAWRTKQGDAA